MIRASFCFETCRKDQQSICFFTESSFQMAGLPTNFCFNQFALRTFEPGRRREQVKYIEQDRACRTGTNQPGFSLTRSIPYPYTHCIFRSYTHCPGIPETITGTGFPGNGLHGRNGTPVYFFRSVHFFYCIKSLPDGSGLERWTMNGDGIRQEECTRELR